MAADKLQAMQTFRRVAELGSFTAAADDLGLTPATISKQIAFLEEDLGTRLIHRTTRRMHLSDTGQEYFERVCQLLDALQETESAVKGLDANPKGRLRINAPMSFGLTHLNTMIDRFQQQYPDVEVDLQLNDSVVDLVAEGVDLAIRIRQTLEDSSLTARALCEVGRTLCAAPAYLESAGVPEKPADLQHHRCLIYSLSSSPDLWALGQEQVRVSGAYRANSSLAIKQHLLSGAGVSLVPNFLVYQELRAGELQALLPDYPASGHTIYAVFPPGRHRPAKVRYFLEHLQACIGESPYWEILS